MFGFSPDGGRFTLDDPLLAPFGGSFLWNRRMMIQVTNRGYAVAQFMQPEPAKYAHVPTLAGTSFMQPEQPYFAHHPGRFFYVRDEDKRTYFSAPYEPTRVALDEFEFCASTNDITWRCVKDGLELTIKLGLGVDEVIEFWTVEVTNRSAIDRKLSVVPYFPVGYSSWMNMQAAFDAALGGVVASCVAPYQKLADYFKRSEWKDLTYLIADSKPVAWEANQAAFEGEGGLHAPSALERENLACGEAHYEIPACVMQYRWELEPGESKTLRLLFGPAKDREEIEHVRRHWLSPVGFARAQQEYALYQSSGQGCLRVKTPDETFNHVVNTWLPRQVFYHGDVNRLSTDPQTRNYMQDAMGMAFVQPAKTRAALLLALSQQKSNGEMPDGILLYPGAELKYINQIPHTDHCVWIALCLDTYLRETDDVHLLDEVAAFADSSATASVYEHVCLAMSWLLEARDERGLSYIAQGDWCDPMNMVGYQGKGVSGWLTEATSYALQLLLPVCRQRNDTTRIAAYEQGVRDLNQAINAELWDGNWYARGITDNNVKFGTQKDPEGRIFLNAQSWALLCGAPNVSRRASLLRAVNEQLESPYGVELCAPAFTKMRDDIGRVTQKFPGSAENGSVYNHAAAFYAAALYHVGEGDAAYRVLRKMLPGPDAEDLRQRGQLPVYIPNYYRGAYRQYPRTAGRSSQLVNTGTVAWVYRAIIEQLFGLRGEGAALLIDPQLPAEWATATAVRQFRSATVSLTVTRGQVTKKDVRVNGELCADARLVVEPGKRYVVDVVVP
jgi:cellobionic acid phosphorylase